MKKAKAVEAKKAHRPRANSKIAAVRSRLIHHKIARPIGTAIGAIGSHGYVAIEVFGEDGEFGICYARAFDLGVMRAAHSVVPMLAETLIGMQASDTTAAWNRMWRRIVLHSRSGVQAYAVSTIDTAIWDLKARLCGLPVFRLLGGARSAVPSYYSGGFLNITDKELAAEAERVIELGCAAFKMRAGLPELKRDVARARLLKKVFGKDIMVDSAGYFDRAGAIRAAQAFSEFSPVWLEDPVPTAKIKDLQDLRNSSAVPFAGGELLYTEAEVTSFGEKNAFDHVLFDLERIGGVTGWIRSAAVADHFGLRISAHVYPEFAAHILCGLENGYYHETLEWSHELFENPPVLKDGYITPSEEPGFGVRFDEGFIRKNLVEEVIIGDKDVVKARR